MTWHTTYRGEGTPRKARLPAPPPWRRFPAPTQTEEGLGIFQPVDGLVAAVNAALALRRPLLLTGAPGSGKSSVIVSVAAELELGEVLRWPINSRSTLAEGLYTYDVLGRIHDKQLDPRAGEDIGQYLQLGPLGHALLPSKRPRALLVDEIDKSDLDLPGDLLDVLERGEFPLRELKRGEARAEVAVHGWAGEAMHPISGGAVRCTEFPFVVMTSNGERDFPAPFLRRCIRFTMPKPSIESVTRVVIAHLGAAFAETPETGDLIRRFIDGINNDDNLAVDQLLNAVFLLGHGGIPDEQTRAAVRRIVLKELSSA